MDLLLVLVAWSLFLADLGYASMAGTYRTIDTVTALEEHNAKKLSNLGNTKLPMSKAAAQHGGRKTTRHGYLVVLCLFRCCPASTRAIDLWRFFRSRYVNMNRLYLFGPRTFDLPRVTNCPGNFVDTPFPGS
ncbi:hypothetical protein N7516_004636 [Penicillium verrucosum]|uniref:uncharacterized protein n=1 Tax=Penicillium verrucosum TaxID=60171 RepID=UPI0025457427|nr:uncharacterized protein N7516_004636 [Penicillium verrucosum]KAJ5944468.1 hypothetical protein N7516_004636 [Penicillium verrucosum]